MRKGIAALVLCVLIAFCGSTQTFAAVIEPDEPIVASPCMEYIDKSSSYLSIDASGNATIDCSVKGFSGTTAHVEIIAKLQRYVDGQWKTIKTYTAEKDSYSVSLTESYQVSKGYTYRVQATFYAYSGLLGESKIVTSNEVKY